MNNRLFIVLIIIFTLLPLSAFSADETDIADEVISSMSETVLIDILAEIKKDGVRLKHKKHAAEYKVGCAECHHMHDPTEDEPPLPCIDCHDLLKTKVIEGIRAPKAQTSVMKNIYHDMCKGCHNKLQRSGKPFPKQCSTCHTMKIK